MKLWFVQAISATEFTATAPKIFSNDKAFNECRKTEHPSK